MKKRTHLEIYFLFSCSVLKMIVTLPLFMKWLTDVNLVELLRSQCPAAVCHLLATRGNGTIFFSAMKQLKKGGKPCVFMNSLSRLYLHSELTTDFWGDRWFLEAFSGPWEDSAVALPGIWEFIDLNVFNMKCRWNKSISRNHPKVHISNFNLLAKNKPQQNS